MAMLKSSSVLVIISLVLIIMQTSSYYALDPLYTICSNSKNFTNKSPYEQNLIKLFVDLNLKTPRTGFGQSSFGQQQSNINRIYGLALCRGDASTKGCATCTVEASSEITKRCPKNREAIIWYDECYLKYSDTDFFGKIDYENKFYLWNLQNVSGEVDPLLFENKSRELLSGLAEKASGLKGVYFATGEVEIGYGDDEKIYGMVQCSRDLDSVECKRCVDEAISEIGGCCGGKRGGRVVNGSCNVRYEMYPFLNLSTM